MTRACVFDDDPYDPEEMWGRVTGLDAIRLSYIEFDEFSDDDR